MTRHFENLWGPCLPGPFGYAYESKWYSGKTRQSFSRRTWCMPVVLNHGSQAPFVPLSAVFQYHL